MLLHVIRTLTLYILNKVINWCIPIFNFLSAHCTFRLNPFKYNPSFSHPVPWPLLNGSLLLFDWMMDVRLVKTDLDWMKLRLADSVPGLLWHWNRPHVQSSQAKTLISKWSHEPSCKSLLVLCSLKKSQINLNTSHLTQIQPLVNSIGITLLNQKEIMTLQLHKLQIIRE